MSFGAFTGNNTLIQWYGLLNKYYGVHGQARISFKLHGKNAMEGVESETAMEELMTGLKNERKGYIYHCYNHYMCPIGFENTPLLPFDAYKKKEEIELFRNWIIVGEISKMYPVFHTIDWEEIYTDINCQFPDFVNIRKKGSGV